MNSLQKGQWRVALMFSSICVWINGWINNREAGDLRHYRAHYDAIVIKRNFPNAEPCHGQNHYTLINDLSKCIFKIKLLWFFFEFYWSLLGGAYLITLRNDLTPISKMDPGNFGSILGGT